MPLRYDDEFKTAATPILEALAAAPIPADHDWFSRRASIASLSAASAQRYAPYPGIHRTEHRIWSFDGAEIIVYRFANGTRLSTLEPAILHVHGGGMIAGGADMFSPSTNITAGLTGLQYFSVEYRLAPEYKHPTLVEDVYAALKWLHEHGLEFNVDVNRIGIEGQSAGGGIAAGVALMARDRNLQPPLAKQILIYPMLDSRTIKCCSELEPYLFWTPSSNLTGWGALLGDQMYRNDVCQYASPSHAQDLSGLPSTYIDVGSLDLFRDEDIHYASRLMAVNNDVEFHLYPGVPHAFEALAPEIRLSKSALANRHRARTSF